jgi:hypothetical protein
MLEEITLSNLSETAVSTQNLLTNYVLMNTFSFTYQIFTFPVMYSNFPIISLPRVCKMLWKIL